MERFSEGSRVEMEESNRKKSKLWLVLKSWKLVVLILIILLCLALYYSFLKGSSGRPGMFAQIWNSLINPTSPNPDSKPTPKEESVVKIVIYFSPQTLHLENWQCPINTNRSLLEKRLREISLEIRKKYPDQKVIVEYEEVPRDPYFVVQASQEILTQYGIIFDWKKKK